MTNQRRIVRPLIHTGQLLVALGFLSAGTSLGLAFAVPVAAEADRSPAQHLGARPSQHELQSAAALADRGCGLAATEGHDHPTVTGDTVMAVQHLAIRHVRRHWPLIDPLADELDIGVADCTG